jgi:hypothetical protein
MKILLLDIETAPHKVWSWGLFKQTIAINQIEEPGYTLCWAAKWYGEDKVMFADINSGKTEMLLGIYDLVDQADVVVHYNGSHFDIPTLNQEWLAQGWSPPSPVIQIDLLQTVRKRFRLPSNKLNYISEYLKLGSKINHKGMELWRECMNGVPESWAVMQEYNIQDVTLLERLYDVLRPWIINHPNHGLFSAEELQVCPNCGSQHLQKRGLYYTKTQTYQRYRCMTCGSWSKEKSNNVPKEKKQFILSGIN